MDPTSCVVLSGGGSGRLPRLGGFSVEYLVETGRFARSAAGDSLAAGKLFEPVPGRDFLWALPLSPHQPPAPLVLVARARLDQESTRGEEICPVSRDTKNLRAIPGQDNRGRLWRDVRLTKFALQEALAFAEASGRTRVVSTLLAAGGLRTIPLSYTLQEMIRCWSNSPQRNHVSLTIHVVDKDAMLDLESGRLDVSRLFALADDIHPPRSIEFWLEIVARESEAERVLIMDAPTRSIRDVLAEHSIDGENWLLTVEPAPCLSWAARTFADIDNWEASRGGRHLSAFK